MKISITSTEKVILPDYVEVEEEKQENSSILNSPIWQGDANILVTLICGVASNFLYALLLHLLKQARKKRIKIKVTTSNGTIEIDDKTTEESLNEYK